MKTVGLNSHEPSVPLTDTDTEASLHTSERVVAVCSGKVLVALGGFLQIHREAFSYVLTGFQSQSKTRPQDLGRAIHAERVYEMIHRTTSRHFFMITWCCDYKYITRREQGYIRQRWGLSADLKRSLQACVTS